MWIIRIFYHVRPSFDQIQVLSPINYPKHRSICPAISRIHGLSYRCFIRLLGSRLLLGVCFLRLWYVPILTLVTHTSMAEGGYSVVYFNGYQRIQNLFVPPRSYLRFHWPRSSDKSGSTRFMTVIHRDGAWSCLTTTENLDSQPEVRRRAVLHLYHRYGRCPLRSLNNLLIDSSLF